MKKRIVSLLLTLVMVLSLVPMSVFAADNHDGQVHVIVENTTYPEAEGAPWEGTLVEEWIDLDEDSTMMGCVVKALEKNGYEQTGAENNYISSIQGLGEFDGGSMSGWMGTLNDWFTNRGFGDFTVAAGTLGSGDEIRIMYTRNGYGADLGGSWDNHIKTVKALTFSAGELSPAFDPDTHEYTLTVDKGTDSVLVTPTASNKNYQVRTYVGETEYKRTAMVPTVDGTTITVKCGDPSWPNMNNDNEPAQVYTVNVKVKSDDKPVTPTNTKVLVRAQDGGAWLHQPMVSELTGGEAEKYGYTDKVEGVSALDALVVSHELTFGDDFTPPRISWRSAAAALSPSCTARRPMSAASMSTPAIPTTAPRHPPAPAIMAPRWSTPSSRTATWWISSSMPTIRRIPTTIRGSMSRRPW